MRYIDEFRDPALARSLLKRIERLSKRPVQFMEFCGGHTHAIFQYGIREMLPRTVRLRAGPGCPVCVTSAADVDRAVALATVPGAIITTFGDMVRVPGSQGSLQEAQAAGADVRVVYSPLDALQVARRNPGRPVIFLAVGFETTAPAVAATLLQAEAEGVGNFYLYSLHKQTLPAMLCVLEAGEVALDGVIGPGHVSTVIGAEAWLLLPQEYRVPCVIAGFEPLDILKAIGDLVEMVESGEPGVGNAYGRSVQAEGNPVALATMWRVFQSEDAEWRGLGWLPASGLGLRPQFAHRDALAAFPVEIGDAQEPISCRCGDVIRGAIEPTECPLFGRACTPLRPVGPCMVSAEGTCSAYYRYGGEW